MLRLHPAPGAVAFAFWLAAVCPLADSRGDSRPEQASQQAAPGAATPAAAQTAEPPTLRTTTRLVQISVVAHDKHGTPLPDLTEHDFRVFDNGQEQKIAFFSKESSELTAGSAPALPPNTWSNAHHNGVPVNLSIILFDGLNTKVTDQGRARSQIVRFLGQMKPEDRMALYFLGDNLHILHDFTSDMSSLLRILAKSGAYDGRLVPAEETGTDQVPSVGDDDADLFIRNSEEFFHQYQIQNQVLRTTDAFEAIASHVAALPGRKNLLWVSGSFPLMIGYDASQMNTGDPAYQFLHGPGLNPGLDQRMYVEEVERAARALNDANVAVYPVDARGLAMDMRAVTQPMTIGGRIRPDTPQSMTPDVALLEAMEEVAARTGGVAYHDTNDIAGSLHKAMEDSRVVYTLSFTPTHSQWNGEFRKVRVECSRPGTQLRYRSGYFAFPDKPVDPVQKDQILAQAQWSVLDATEIGLTLNAARVTAPTGQRINFAVLADPAGIRFADAEGRKSADLVLTLGEKGADGKLVQEETKTLTLRLTDDRYRAVLEHGLRLTGGMPLDPAAVQFRVVMLDTSTGHLGSLEFPLGQLLPAAPPAAAPGGAAARPAPPSAQKP